LDRIEGSAESSNSCWSAIAGIYVRDVFSWK
jgi:hypothetical protein